MDEGEKQLELSKTIDLLAKMESIIIEELHTTIKVSSELSALIASEEAKLPYRINVIKSAAVGKLKETAHSMILVDLLNYESIRKSFVEYFFKPHYEGFEIDSAKVAKADTNRIDVSIRGKNFFLIIENKVNGAPEQQGQIYRYFKVAEAAGYKEQIYVLYLNPESNEPPSYYSLNKEGQKVADCVKDKLGDRLIVKNYKIDVCEWLKTIEINDEKEKYLKSAILQYIDYLEINFRTSNIYTEMNNKIDKLLREKLALDSESPIESIKSIDDKIKSADELKNSLNTLKMEYMKLLLLKIKDNFGDSYVLKSDGRMLTRCFEYDNKKMNVILYVKDNLQIYWAVYCAKGNLVEDDVIYFKKMVENVDLTISIDTKDRFYYPIWNYTSSINALKRYKLLVQVLKDEGLLLQP